MWNLLINVELHLGKSETEKATFVQNIKHRCRLSSLTLSPNTLIQLLEGNVLAREYHFLQQLTQ